MTKPTDPPSTTLHIAWTEFQRRQDSMAPLAGFECVFLKRSTRRGLIATAMDYLRLAARTWRLIQVRRPEVLWIQLPPAMLLWVALAARRLLGLRMKIVADCHNAVLRPPWSRVPGAVRWLRHCDAVVVHNAAVLQDARALGIPEALLRVLEDVPPQVVKTPLVQSLSCMPPDSPRPWILLPGSFSADEPIAEVAAVARNMPEATFIMTGRIERAARHGHDLSALPRNVVTPGYLARQEFDLLVQAADVMLGLTNYEGVQLSVCNEALGFGKALVVSDTRVLRQLFSSACEMTPADHQPETLEASIRRALSRCDELGSRARQLAQVRVAAWQSTQYAEVLALLGQVRRQAAST